jgi:2-methylcitrate dehydratase PrpD
VRQVIVRIAASAAKVVNNREMPDVCLQHMVAVMLLDKTATFQAAHDQTRMKDSEVLKQRAKVQLIGDADLEKVMPRREAIVEVTLADGTKLTEHVAAVRGTPANPMPREEVVAKARDLMTPVLGPATASALIEKIMALENVKNILALRPLLQRS